MANDFTPMPSTRSEIVWRVAVVASKENCRALQWLFRDDSLTDEKVDFSLVPLPELKENFNEFDVFLIVLDMGQPVPRQHLQSLSEKPGLCALVQPTPHQLLQVADVPRWRSIKWEPGDFGALARELIKTIDFMKNDVRQVVLLESVERWVSKKLKIPARIVFSNPPADFTGSTNVSLDSQRALVSIGCDESHSDIRLPYRGPEELLQIHFSSGRWRCRKTGLLNLEIVLPRNGEDLLAGDSIKIGRFELDVTPSRSVEELLGILHQSGVQREPSEFRTDRQFESILELFREFMMSALSGELRITGPTRSASVFLEGGRIQQILCGSVYGIKAMVRVFSWPEFRWVFNIHKRTHVKLPAMDMGFLEMRNIYKRWEGRWKRLASYAPPHHLKVRIKPDIFLAKKSWSSQDFSVAAAICQFESVGEVMNNCPLLDIDIVDSLVRLRKEGLLAIN